MDESKSEYLKYRIERAKETIREARNAIDNDLLFNAQNRIYYAIFYIVSAFALKNNFSTSKHMQLMAWFNVNFINTKKLDVELMKIYSKAYKFRQKGDYQDMVYFTKEEMESNFADMLKFVSEIEKVIEENKND